jgi:formate-dependent nitrite reductase cytochrome c552 subunit
MFTLSRKKGTTKRIRSVFTLAFLAFLSMGGFASAEKYAGTESCLECHQEIYNNFMFSGHPFKLRTVEDAKVSGIPLPDGYTWDDISYVIGGRNWKIRYIDDEGYIITMTGPNLDKPGKNQFNIETGEWSDYHPGEKKKYDCGGCHTTGYSKEGHQDDLEGIIGTWVFPGIQCEACHGPAGKHVAKLGDPAYIKTDRSITLCAQCHVRGDKLKIPAEGGFIRHHAQYNELSASPKPIMSCVTCHDAHKRAVLSIKVTCMKCHAKETSEYAGSQMALRGVRCVDCHMPKATKSAVKKSEYEADIRTHLFKINTDPQAKMFTKDGKFANGFITLEFACLGCHTAQSKEWALKYSKGIHTLGK